MSKLSDDVVVGQVWIAKGGSELGIFVLDDVGEGPPLRLDIV